MIKRTPKFIRNARGTTVLIEAATPGSSRVYMPYNR